MSVDPLTKEYADLTPYQFASNNPIWMIDLDGLEGLCSQKLANGTYTSAQDAAYYKPKPILTVKQSKSEKYLSSENAGFDPKVEISAT